MISFLYIFLLPYESHASMAADHRDGLANGRRRGWNGGGVPRPGKVELEAGAASCSRARARRAPAMMATVGIWWRLFDGSCTEWREQGRGNGEEGLALLGLLGGGSI